MRIWSLHENTNFHRSWVEDSDGVVRDLRYLVSEDEGGTITGVVDSGSSPEAALNSSCPKYRGSFATVADAKDKLYRLYWLSQGNTIRHVQLLDIYHKMIQELHPSECFDWSTLKIQNVGSGGHTPYFWQVSAKSGFFSGYAGLCNPLDERDGRAFEFMVTWPGMR